MTMDQKTKDALEASIRHWQENVDAETPGQVKLGQENCALCKVFNEEIYTCLGCPIQDETGKTHCNGSPYHYASIMGSRWKREPTSNEAKQAWREAAQAELDFLIFLLPSYEVAE